MSASGRPQVFSGARAERGPARPGFGPSLRRRPRSAFGVSVPVQPSRQTAGPRRLLAFLPSPPAPLPKTGRGVPDTRDLGSAPLSQQFLGDGPEVVAGVSE